MSQILLDASNDRPFDQLDIERAVRSLCKTSVRHGPLSLEQVKSWIKQFESDAERSLGWLLLRHLVYRTSTQLESSLRQALKEASKHYLRDANIQDGAHWRDALSGQVPGIHFYCGPLAVDGMRQPGKSGEVITRLVSSRYKIQKYYPQDVTEMSVDERYLIVDDGIYTGTQMVSFLERWRKSYTDNKVAIVVGLAHENAIRLIGDRFPSIPVFYGELLTEKNSLPWLSQQWQDEGHWPHEESTPLDVYLNLADHRAPFEQSASLGFGSLGLILAFEHGIPDDSLQLLWARSSSWIPLIER